MFKEKFACEMFNQMWEKRSSLVCIVLSIVLTVLCFDVYVKSFIINSEDVEAKFMEYISLFNKSYRFNVDEYQKRYTIFQKSLATINSMNTHRKHNDSARFGLTEYSDMSYSEFAKTKLNGGFKNSITNRQRNSIMKEQADSNRPISYNIIRYARNTKVDVPSLPKRIDWRERGVVSEIRNQGLCGACWAHSVIETVESMLAIQGNSSLVHLSVQQMIDCAANNNRGCHGGDTCNLLTWLVQERIDIQRMAAYPMNSADTKCKMANINGSSQTVQVKGFTCESFVGREEKILHILANYGPVTIAVNGLLWQNYLGGIIQFHCDGSMRSLNHAVQIVGYDMAGDIPYYIVRNSWGRRFGDKGYLKIQIGGNVCGVANQVSTLEVNIAPLKLT